MPKQNSSKAHWWTSGRHGLSGDKIGRQGSVANKRPTTSFAAKGKPAKPLEARFGDYFAPLPPRSSSQNQPSNTKAMAESRTRTYVGLEQGRMESCPISELPGPAPFHQHSKNPTRGPFPAEGMPTDAPSTRGTSSARASRHSGAHGQGRPVVIGGVERMHWLIDV